MVTRLMECTLRVILDVLVATVHFPVPVVGQQRTGILNYTYPKGFQRGFNLERCLRTSNIICNHYTSPGPEWPEINEVPKYARGVRDESRLNAVV